MIYKALFALAIMIAAFAVVTLYLARAHEKSAEKSHPAEGQFINIDGFTVHAVVRGSGPDLVLIHGASGNTRDFTLSLVDRLAATHRVIVFDRPGLGYSDDINPQGATLIQQAEHLIKAAKRLGADRPIVLGHSYGGGVALAWATHHRDALSALVLVSSPSNPWTTPLDFLYKLTSHPILGPLSIPMLTAYVRNSRVDAALVSVFAPQAVPEGYSTHIGSGLTLRRGSMHANGMQRANLKGEIAALVPMYGEITTPTEIIHGTADTIVSTKIHSDVLVNQIDGAILTRLDGIGHAPHHIAQDAVIDAIMRATARAQLR